MTVRSWAGNARGEWYVVAQAVLALLVFGAPLLDGRSPSTGGAWPVVTTVAAGLVGLAGVGFAVLGALRLGSSLSPFPRPTDGATLVKTGIYGLVRHPIYTGLILICLGWTLLWRSPAALLATLVLFVFFDVKARREERWLRDKFDGYASYQRRVKKLVPFVY